MPYTDKIGDRLDRFLKRQYTMKLAALRFVRNLNTRADRHRILEDACCVVTALGGVQLYDGPLPEPVPEAGSAG